MEKKARLIAFYLPQYHPVPENDEWWGKGFTEWTNVGRAKPLFKGHVQPKIPRDLGYYDLRVPETREQQAELAKFAGIEGFCYWHYWFGNGKQLLNRPFDEVLISGKPDFPFCLGWANHSWKKKTWSDDKKDKLLIEQQYPGIDDINLHFNTLLPAFKDKRYLKINNRLIFVIWDSINMPDSTLFFETWNKLAIANGLEGFYFVGFTYDKLNVNKILKIGFDSACLDLVQEYYFQKSIFQKSKRKIKNILGIITPRIIPYKKYSDLFCRIFETNKENVIPCILPNFDHSPRNKRTAVILTNPSPVLFVKLLKKVLSIQKTKSDDSKELVFVKSWNEWGEGNYLEPDMEFGDSFITELHNYTSSSL
ncbi:glycoside hydrolase family 99-like domain-containing protein [uncultured Bacteroides sp.]|uniref:glycosyltransferase WbsX family protein n=1 Tax=uncultured Bacteroides sp. TaxID=162156 RepID=UPI002AAB90C0|nr:glycoside hydrolase family 99-like domain-containing protein [uncultured Bacteroides sp.]